MVPGGDWCLQCGAGAPGSVEGPGWRPAATLVVATVVLVLAATAAGYAALSKKARHAPVRVATVAAPAPPVSSTPAAVTPLPLTPTTPTVTPTIAKPPTIPLKAATPAPAPATTPTTSSGGEESNNGSKGKGGTETGGASTEAEAILLDTNAASTYNPYTYPATDFGDPSLAIDGDGSTGWTAQINPATAPKLAEGVLIDLKSLHKLSYLKLITTTPGMTVQVYGAAGHTVPASITDPAWVPLSRSVTVHKRHARLNLRRPKQGFRFVTLWISRAPASSVGTAEAPGRVTVNELELFPPA
jgi:hypothetical protein